MLVMPGYKTISTTHNIGGSLSFGKQLKGKTSNGLNTHNVMHSHIQHQAVFS
jgi:hypothetical protein